MIFDTIAYKEKYIIWTCNYIIIIIIATDNIKFVCVNLHI